MTERLRRYVQVISQLCGGVGSDSHRTQLFWFRKAARPAVSDTNYEERPEAVVRGHYNRLLLALRQREPGTQPCLATMLAGSGVTFLLVGSYHSPEVV